MIMRSLRHVGLPLATVALALTVACGGGGSSPSPAPAPTPTPTPTVTSRSLWVNNLDAAGTWQQASFVRVYQNDRCNVWVRDVDQAKVSADLAKTYGDSFRDRSWKDVTTAVYEPKEFFGEAGNRINILMYELYQDPKALGTVAGFFWEKDFYSQKDWDAYLSTHPGVQMKSNEGNYFYINTRTSVSATKQAAATAYTLGTLTHEFQHMCQAHYFNFDAVGSAKPRSMDSWANEMCSIVMESVFAGQMDYYLTHYVSGSAFKKGATDFLQWGTDPNQYISAAMMGTYLYSQVPAANQANFIRSFIQNTAVEGTGTTTLTSVEDLLATLQDPKLGFSLAGLQPVTNFATDTAKVRDNWVTVFRGFGGALTGANAAYNTFLKGATAVSLAPATVLDGGSFPLKPSGYLMARTYTKDLTGDAVSSATGDATLKPVYAFVFNATLPSRDLLGSSTAVLPTATVTLDAAQLAPATPAPAVAARLAGLDEWLALRFYGSPVDQRLMGDLGVRPAVVSPASTFRATVLGAGNPANGGSDTAGFNYCVFLTR